QVRHPCAGCSHGRADAAHLAGRAGAAGNLHRLGARSRRQVRPGVRAGGRPRSLPRRSQGTDRARQRARAPRTRRGELRRGHGELHAREDRDAQRSPGPGLPRQGPHPRGCGAVPAGHRGQRVPGGRAERRMTPLVQLRGLRKSYGRRRALAGVDLELTERQIVGVVGPDGAGKSTLLRALVGLLEVDADEALVLGHDLRADVTELKAHIGYVPQVFSLHRDLTIAENLRFTARLHRLPTAEAEARIAALLERTALTRFAERFAAALSGGMKQKLAVANALLPRPAVLVLDEPT